MYNCTTYIHITTIKEKKCFCLTLEIISVKNINFNNKKIWKSDFYKNKKIFQIDDIIANNI